MCLQINDLPKEYITSFAKFRVSAHSLQIEKGIIKLLSNDYVLCVKLI